jgi:MFS family permease
VVADHVEQRALMVACDLGNASIFFAIAGLDPPFEVLLVLVSASAMLDTLFAPAGRSVVPALVESDDLVQANAWIGTSLNLQVALGTMLGGALVASLGARGALTADAVSFLVSAAVLVGLPPLRAPREGERRGFLAVGIEGLAYAWRTPTVRALVLALFFGVAFATVDNVALVFLVRETLEGGPVAYGLVTAAFGVGMTAASVGLSWRRTTLAMGTLVAAGWLASGAGTMLTGLAPLIAVAAAAQMVAGFGNGLENVAADTLVQRVVPRMMLGRLFGLTSTAAFAGSALAYAIGGFVLDLTSPRLVFLLGGSGVLVVTTFLWMTLRREGIA